MALLYRILWYAVPRGVPFQIKFTLSDDSKCSNYVVSVDTLAVADQIYGNYFLYRTTMLKRRLPVLHNSFLSKWPSSVSVGIRVASSLAVSSCVRPKTIWQSYIKQNSSLQTVKQLLRSATQLIYGFWQNLSLQLMISFITWIPTAPLLWTSLEWLRVARVHPLKHCCPMINHSLVWVWLSWPPFQE